MQVKHAQKKYVRAQGESGTVPSAGIKHSGDVLMCALEQYQHKRKNMLFEYGLERVYHDGKILSVQRNCVECSVNVRRDVNQELCEKAGCSM